MRRIALPALLVAAVLAGCANFRKTSIEQKLVGSWQQQITIFGERKQSILTLLGDGTFTETGTTVSSRLSAAHLPLHGTWRVRGNVVELVYATGFLGRGAAETDVRVIVALDDREFVSTDRAFGLEVRRTRYRTPGG